MNLLNNNEQQLMKNILTKEKMTQQGQNVILVIIKKIKDR